MWSVGAHPLIPRRSGRDIVANLLDHGSCSEESLFANEHELDFRKDGLRFLDRGSRITKGVGPAKEQGREGG